MVVGPKSPYVAEFNDEQLRLYIIIILEFCTGIVAICTGANLHYFHITSSCKGFQFLGNTLIFIGIALLFFFVITCVWARTPKLVVPKSLYGSVPLVVVLLVLGIFVLSVSSQGGGKSVPGRSYKVYKVESYSKWMQNKVNDNWNDYYKKAIVKNKGEVCDKVSHLLGAHPTLMHGCCQPPEKCNFSYTNPKVKVMQRNGNYSNNNEDDDCNRWDNDPNTLCFDCESCKASFLQDVTSHWFTTGIGLVVAAGIPLSMGLFCFIVKMYGGSAGIPLLLYCK